MVRRVLAIALLMLGGAGCRQPVGDMPIPQGEQVNKVGDIGRDLLNIANRDQAAPAELVDDLQALDGAVRPDAEVYALTSALTMALAGRSLSEARAQELAAVLFVASTGRRLSQQHIDGIGPRIRETLAGIDVPEAAVTSVATAATALASAVTTNRRRWYHLF